MTPQQIPNDLALGGDDCSHIVRCHEDGSSINRRQTWNTVVAGHKTSGDGADETCRDLVDDTSDYQIGSQQSCRTDFTDDAGMLPKTAS